MCLKVERVRFWDDFLGEFPGESVESIPVELRGLMQQLTQQRGRTLFVPAATFYDQSL